MIHCISDLHLDAVSHGVVRREEILASVEYCLTSVEKGDHVVCLGDVTDPGNASYRAIADALAIDRKVRDKGAACWWMEGNHDAVEDGSGTSILEPLKEASCRVIDRPMKVKTNEGFFAFLPHVPLTNRYDVEQAFTEFLLSHRESPMAIFGHLNLIGIKPGSEVTYMPRGRDVFWPKDGPIEHNVICVGGHIHKAQKYSYVEIVGSPVRFTFGEEDHTPQTFSMKYAKDGWSVHRKKIPGVRSFRTFTSNPPEGTSTGDFVKAPAEFAEQAEKVGAHFISLPTIAPAEPRVAVNQEAVIERRVREVVLDVAKAYPSAESGLLDLLNSTMDGVDL